jgi:hypothetical protein
MADFKVFHQISLSLETYNIFLKVEAQKDLSIFQDFIIKAYWEKLVQPGQGFDTKSAYITPFNFDFLLFSSRRTLCPLWFVLKKGVVHPDSV